MGRFILAFDQGTTSSRALIFDEEMNVVGSGQQEFKQIYPQPGFVEHDPSEIWQTSLAMARKAIERAGIDAGEIAAIGITNQRETSLIWERATLKPLSNAIVWQDRRTSEICEHLKAEGHGAMIAAKTGLLLDPYFSATKLQWLLDRTQDFRRRGGDHEICFGTVDSWLIANLTKGATFKTDATNASRTMLFNIHNGDWDEELLRLFDVPRAMLGDVEDCAGDFGIADKSYFGHEIPIRGVAGDQHAALIGQACFEPGMMKSTYGTGCFALLNTGERAIASSQRLLTTIAYQLDGTRHYALEGSIFIAGAGVQWLRDEVGVIEKACECDDLASQSNLDDPVCLVPAFAGLGAPYWRADVRGALFGLTRGTGRNEIIRAALEAVGYQTRDLMQAIGKDWPDFLENAQKLRVDGGMTASGWTMQFLADILQCSVERAQNAETTALGVAYLAGLTTGLYPDRSEFAQGWRSDCLFEPKMAQSDADAKYNAWTGYVARLCE